MGSIYKNKLIVCQYCNVQFATPSNLYRHQKLLHNKIPQYKATPKKKCVQCGKNFFNAAQLLEHLESHHGVPSQKKEVLKFKTEIEFEDWKKKEEKETCSSFVKTHHRECPLTGNSIQDYKCNRDGFYNSQANKRFKKGTKTCKIGGCCPAMIQLHRLPDNSSEVIYVKSHFGHGKELEKLRLSLHDRNILKEKLRHKVPKDVILKELTQQSDKGDSLGRLGLTTSKDLRNIAASMGMNAEHKLNNDDKTNLNKWVETSKGKDDNPFLYCKHQDEEDTEYPGVKKNDFVMVIQTSFQVSMMKKICHTTPAHTGRIITVSTHGLPYDMELTTLLGMDEFGKGFPVAHLISNRVNASILALFYSELRKKLGIVKPSYFMSDDFPAFFNAWIQVMGAGPQKLLSTLHVNKIWGKTFDISTQEGKQVHDALKALQSEMDDMVFKQSSQGLLNKLKENDQSTYRKYVKKYIDRSAEWAYCYRKHSGLTVNIYLENFHKTFEVFYCKGKKIVSLDKTISELVSCIKLMHQEHLKVINKNCPSFKITQEQLRLSHKESLSIPSESVFRIDKNHYSVKSSSCDGFYSVEISEDTCDQCSNKCNKFCELCRKCIHVSKCNCRNNISNPMCKHIHKVITQFKLRGPPNIKCSQNPTSYEEDNDMYSMELESEPSTSPLTKSKKEDLMDKISLRLASLRKLSKSKHFKRLSEEDIENILEHLDAALLVESKLQSNLASIDKSKTNRNSTDFKNINQDHSFNTTKKPRKMKPLQRN